MKKKNNNRSIQLDSSNVDSMKFLSSSTKLFVSRKIGLWIDFLDFENEKKQKNDHSVFSDYWMTECSSKMTYSRNIQNKD